MRNEPSEREAETEISPIVGCPGGYKNSVEICRPSGQAVNFADLIAAVRPPLRRSGVAKPPSLLLFFLEHQPPKVHRIGNETN